MHHCYTVLENLFVIQMMAVYYHYFIGKFGLSTPGGKEEGKRSCNGIEIATQLGVLAIT